MPKVASMAELNELVDAGDAADDERRIFGRQITVGEHFALEAPELAGLPIELFDVGLALNCRVDARSRVCVRQCFYSVPVAHVGRRIDVRLGADRIEALDGAKTIASHPRAVGKGAESLVLDHYLEVLRIKPGALPGATALARARATGSFSGAHDTFWTAARKRLGDQAGTRALIEVLLAQRLLPAAAIVAGLTAANTVGSVDPAVVVIEARRAATSHTTTPVIPVGSLTQFDRPQPRLDRYDTLLEA